MLDAKLSTESVRADFLGLCAGTPPCIAVAYTTTQGKRRLRRMRPRIAADATAEHLADSIVKALPASMDARAVSRTQVMRLAHMLLQQSAASSGERHLPLSKHAPLGQQITYINPHRDYNKADDNELHTVKAAMDVSFEQNAVRPGNVAYKYDLQRDFEQLDTENDWDDSDGGD